MSMNRMTDPYRGTDRPEFPPTLAEFLLARIADDEGDAHSGVWHGGQSKCAGRVLAECEAKRRIVQDHRAIDLTVRFPGTTPRCNRCRNLEASETDRHMFAAFPCQTVRLLASIYADHPDYREEWRP